MLDFLYKEKLKGLEVLTDCLKDLDTLKVSINHSESTSKEYTIQVISQNNNSI